MLIKSSPERIITYVWLSVILAWCWPLSSKATKMQIMCYKTLRAGSIFSAILLLLPLSYAMYLHYDDSIIFIKSTCLAVAVSQVIIQTLFVATQYERLQRLIEEMQLFCKNMKSHERHVFQEYIQKRTLFYGGCILWFYASALLVVLGALLIPQPFPTSAEYPFSIDYLPLKRLLFLHQSLVGIQCAAHVSVNGFGALLLWFSAARFEILRRELQAVTDVSNLILCVRKNEEIRRYATDAARVVRFIVLITICVSISLITFSGITILSKQSFTIKIQFLALSALGLLEVFMCAWPADHLMDMSLNAANGVYESEWYRQALYLQKYILCVMLPQRPVTVSISCIMPILSLSYYCSYLSNVFTVFTACRVAFMDEDGN